MRHFKCVKKGGCRITDLNLPLIENQDFEVEDNAAQSSRGLRAALNSKWVEETKSEKDE